MFVKSDGELVELAKAGDTNACNLLLSRYNNKLFRYAKKLVKNDSRAMDLTQDTLLNAYKYIQSYKGNSSFYTWLCAIAKNLTYTGKYNGSKTLDIVELKASDQLLVTPEDILYSQQTIEKITEAIKKLDRDSEKHAVFYWLYEDMPLRDIASKLGVKYSYMKNLLYRARKNLQPQLQEVFDEIKNSKRK